MSADTNHGAEPTSFRPSVTVVGTDAHSKPFLQEARALTVNRLGVLLNGLTHHVRPGMAVELHYLREKASFQVVWVGKKRTSLAGQAWVRPLDDKHNIWGIALPESPEPKVNIPHDAEGLSAAILSMDHHSSEDDRREHFRYRCQGTASVAMGRGTGQKSFGILSDISIGGCYVEINAPFAAGTPVSLKLAVGDIEAQLEGIVRSSCPGLGMGIGFVKVTPDRLEELSRLIGAAADIGGGPANPESRETSAADDPAGDQFADEADPRLLLKALLSVLVQKGQVTPAELRLALDEIRSAQRGVPAGAGKPLL